MQTPTQSRYQSHKAHEMQQTVDVKQKLKSACKVKADKDMSDGIGKCKQRIKYCNYPFKIQIYSFHLLLMKLN